MGFIIPQSVDPTTLELLLSQGVNTTALGFLLFPSPEGRQGGNTPLETGTLIGGGNFLLETGTLC